MTPDEPPPPPLSLGDAWDYRDSEPARARTSAVAHLHTPAHAQASVLRAYLDWRDGQLPQATEEVTAAISTLRLGAPSVWLGRGLNILAALQSTLNRADRAVELYEEQVALARHIEDAELTATALHDLAVELRHSDPHRAHAHITEALSTFRQLDYPFGVAIAHANLAEFARDQGDLTGASQHLTEALRYPHLDQHPHLEASLRCTQLELQLPLADPEAARTEQRLWDLQAASRNPELRASVALTLAARTEPDRRVGLLSTALNDLRVLGDHVLLPDLHEQLSSAFEQLGDLPQALTHLRETLAYTRRTHAAERRQNIQTFEVLSRIHALQDQAREERQRNQELQAHLQELRALNARIRELGRTDHLTRLSNREHLFTEGEHLAQTATEDTPVSAALIDVDHFKVVNDTWGHQTGDLVLQRVARMILDVARPGDIAARYGGEEFVLLRAAPVEDLRDSCHDLQQLIRLHPWHEVAAGLRVTLSIGVAQVTRPDFTQLVGDADRRLYQVKREGRNNVSDHD
ncbi:GGDEF domain-containing protein [Deinococcus sedimenti]|uniref:GGDEF domain-containing protein n=1 Tax=Deinococcus sedimenti TaxID=1867090 RepID=A0ABQ2S195_9DEIO|nr:GGDEF domain-containing protein [Deinococcus sedimenti]GGR80539.1 GGDEF domain-containing protein [Deinococcus sedimenti]